MAIATCGHEVEEGIKCYVYSDDRDGRIIFGRYCPDCVIRYYRSGQLESPEMNELISKIVKADWED